MAPDERELSSGEAMVANGSTMMRIENDAMLAVALQRPRDLKKVLAEVTAELKLVPGFAARNYYELPYKTDHGNANVTGPSVYLARMLVRNFGNAATRAYVSSIEDDFTHLSGVFTDLEKSVRMELPFTVGHWQKRRGQMTRLDGQWLLQAIQAGASKAMRNVVIAGLPDWLTQSAYDLSRILAADDTRQKLSKMIEAFMRHGVSRESLEKHVGGNLEKLDDEQLATFRGLFNAVRDGEIQPSEIGAEGPEATRSVADVLSHGAKVTGGTVGEGAGPEPSEDAPTGEGRDAAPAKARSRKAAVPAPPTGSAKPKADERPPERVQSGWNL